MPDLDTRLTAYFAGLSVDADVDELRNQAFKDGRRRRIRSQAIGAAALATALICVVAVVTHARNGSDRVAARGATSPPLFDHPPRQDARVDVPIHTSAGDVIVHVEIDQPSNMCVLIEVPPRPGAGGGCFPFRREPAIELGWTNIADPATGMLTTYAGGATRADVAAIDVVSAEGTVSVPTTAVPGLDLRVYVAALNTATTRQVNDLIAKAADGTVIATQRGVNALLDTNELAPCNASDFTAEAISAPPATGTVAPIIKLTNGATPCSVKGYPAVRFEAADGSDLPFVIAHGGGQIVTADPPKELVVQAGAAMFVRVEKYRCDTTVPIEFASAILSFGLGDIDVSGALSDLAFCGPGDPGSTVIITPFEPSIDATFHR